MKSEVQQMHRRTLKNTVADELFILSHLVKCVSFFRALWDENADGELFTTYRPLMIRLRCCFGARCNDSH